MEANVLLSFFLDIKVEPAPNISNLLRFRDVLCVCLPCFLGKIILIGAFLMHCRNRQNSKVCIYI